MLAMCWPPGPQTIFAKESPARAARNIPEGIRQPGSIIWDWKSLFVTLMMQHMVCANIHDAAYGLCSHRAFEVATFVGDTSSQPSRPGIDAVVDFVTCDHAIGRDDEAAKLGVIAASPPLLQEFLDLGLPKRPDASIQWIQVWRSRRVRKNICNMLRHPLTCAFSRMRRGVVLSKCVIAIWPDSQGSSAHRTRQGSSGRQPHQAWPPFQQRPGAWGCPWQRL